MSRISKTFDSFVTMVQSNHNQFSFVPFNSPKYLMLRSCRWVLKFLNNYSWFGAIAFKNWFWIVSIYLVTWILMNTIEIWYKIEIYERCSFPILLKSLRRRLKSIQWMSVVKSRLIVNFLYCRFCLWMTFLSFKLFPNFLVIQKMHLQWEP